MHLPVGGRRFRPTVEDTIDFLLRAAVRRNPDAAVEILRELGHIS